MELEFLISLDANLLGETGLSKCSLHVLVNWLGWQRVLHHCFLTCLNMHMLVNWPTGVDVTITRCSRDRNIVGVYNLQWSITSGSHTAPIFGKTWGAYLYNCMMNTSRIVVSYGHECWFCHLFTACGFSHTNLIDFIDWHALKRGSHPFNSRVSLVTRYVVILVVRNIQRAAQTQAFSTTWSLEGSRLKKSWQSRVCGLCTPWVRCRECSGLWYRSCLAFAGSKSSYLEATGNSYSRSQCSYLPIPVPLQWGYELWSLAIWYAEDIRVRFLCIIWICNTLLECSTHCLDTDCLSSSKSWYWYRVNY